MKRKLLLSFITVILATTIMASIIPTVPVVLDGIYYTVEDYNKLVINQSLDVKHFVLNRVATKKNYIYAFTTEEKCLDFINVCNKTDTKIKSASPRTLKVKLYVDTKFKNESQTAKSTDYKKLSYLMENNIESIKIAKQGGWVILYDEVDYQGNSLYIMSDIKLKDLNVYNWGDRVSSFKTHEYQPTIDEYKQLP